MVTDVMARPGWRSGNPIAVQLRPADGTGQRSAYSFDGNPAYAARLHVTYVLDMQLTTYAYDEANRLMVVDGAPYTWDDNGNLVSDGEKTYTYNQANRLTELTDGTTTYQFNYNGDGARLWQVIAGVPTTYTQDLAAPLPVVLQSKTGANSTKYVYALGTRPLVQYGSAWMHSARYGKLWMAVAMSPWPNRMSHMAVC